MGTMREPIDDKKAATIYADDVFARLSMQSDENVLRSGKVASMIIDLIDAVAADWRR